MLPYILAVIYLGVTIYTANQVHSGVWQPAGLRILLYIAIALMFLLAMFPFQVVVLQSGNLAPEGTDLPNISFETAIATMVFALIAASISIGVVNFAQVRQLMVRITGSSSQYNPDSLIHTTAVVLMCLLLTGVISLFILSGGLAGMAESLQTSGIDPLETLVTTMLEVVTAVLGVGYAIRRTAPETLQRLGLVLPTRRQVITGIGGGIGLYIIATLFVLIWTAVVSPETLAQQTQAAEQLTLALGSLPIALIVSISAAVGEEILIRGALQPIFGIVISSAFFTLLHTQYLITPTLLIIFLISVGFGLLRRRYNTTIAIIAHFVYDFFPLLLLVLSGGRIGS